MTEVDALLEAAQREIRQGLAGTLADCLAKCTHAVEMIEEARSRLTQE
jgi:hypothetical protein